MEEKEGNAPGIAKEQLILAYVQEVMDLYVAQTIKFKIINNKFIIYYLV
jgi:hypothetical protein